MAGKGEAGTQAALDAQAPCFVSREFAIPTGAGDTIAAVIESARPGVRQPTVVLISGAGAYTRDYFTDEANGVANHAFVALARRLMRGGFAVVRTLTGRRHDPPEPNHREDIPLGDDRQRIPAHRDPARLVREHERAQVGEAVGPIEVQQPRGVR